MDGRLQWGPLKRERTCAVCGAEARLVHSPVTHKGTGETLGTFEALQCANGHSRLTPESNARLKPLLAEHDAEYAAIHRGE